MFNFLDEWTPTLLDYLPQSIILFAFLVAIFVIISIVIINVVNKNKKGRKNVK